ncbi:hypothetical protein P3T76_004483 [Phytophthora citrophthora]|uniref:Uncharacterized protein n=1 Tax=Phytophthora citrophthora TaxID=4793 RepID=A0AAD9LQC7_9STRA|nr:hypothetical protein P3T76_004483 [Phytophthora citrophthora]
MSLCNEIRVCYRQRAYPNSRHGKFSNRIPSSGLASVHEQHPCMGLTTAARQQCMGLFVAAQEERAYRIARRMYLTSIEILSIVTVVSFLMRHHIFSMCESKWILERQRSYNSINLALDAVTLTPTDVIWVQYVPLLRIIGASFGALLLYSAIKCAYLTRHVTRTHTFVWSTRWCGRRSSLSVKDLLSGSQLPQKQIQYERSDLEVLLHCPVRAKSLIRNSTGLETINRDGIVEATLSCALDFGVMVHASVAHSRICFWDACVSSLAFEILQRPEHLTTSSNQHQFGYSSTW